MTAYEETRIDYPCVDACARVRALKRRDIGRSVYSVLDTVRTMYVNYVLIFFSLVPSPRTRSVGRGRSVGRSVGRSLISARRRERGVEFDGARERVPKRSHVHFSGQSYV